MGGQLNRAGSDPQLCKKNRLSPTLLLMAHSESKLQRELALTRRLDRLVMAPKFELLAFCAPEFVLLKRLKNKERSWPAPSSRIL